MKQLFAAILIYLAAAVPALADWSPEAVQALPYVYHEQELKTDIAAIDAALRTLSLQRLRDYYVAEVNKQPFAQAYPQPLVFDDISGNFVTFYQDVQNNFLRSVEAGESNLLSVLEREERQAHRNELNSEDMVALKNISLKQSIFFELPLSFYNYQRFSKDVEADPKTDLSQRQALAQQLVSLLHLQETQYVIEGNEINTPFPEVVEKNLANSLTNNESAAQLAELVAFADSDTGHSFLAMKERAFRARFIGMQEVYRRALAQAVSDMRARIVLLPPLVYPVHPLRHHRHHDKDDDHD